MSTHSTSTELNKMSAQELQRDAGDKRNDIAKLQMNVCLGSEKDTAKLRRERRYLARILTALNSKPKTATVPAPKKAKKSSSSKK
jgi:ribosomal protein L29